MARSLEGKAKQDFTKAARDRQQQKTNMEDDELSVTFNDAGEFVEGAHREGEDERSHAKSGWKKRAEKLQEDRKLDHGRGYGYKPIDGE